MDQMTSAEYAQHGGSKCPNCGSFEITGGGFDTDGGYAYQKIKCNDCEHTWEDEYKLVGYAKAR